MLVYALLLSRDRFRLETWKDRTCSAGTANRCDSLVNLANRHDAIDVEEPTLVVSQPQRESNVVGALLSRAAQPAAHRHALE